MANSPNMAAVILFNRRSINDLSFGPPVARCQGGNCDDNAESRGGGESVGTILLVNDDEARRKLIRMRLADTDEVIETLGSEEGIELALREKPAEPTRLHDPETFRF
jgi:hypothetical protein